MTDGMTGRVVDQEAKRLRWAYIAERYRQGMTPDEIVQSVLATGKRRSRPCERFTMAPAWHLPTARSSSTVISALNGLRRSTSSETPRRRRCG